MDNRSQKQRDNKLVLLCKDFGFTLNKLRSHQSFGSRRGTWSNWPFTRIPLPALFRDPSGVRMEGGRNLKTVRSSVATPMRDCIGFSLATTGA